MENPLLIIHQVGGTKNNQRFGICLKINDCNSSVKLDKNEYIMDYSLSVERWNNITVTFNGYYYKLYVKI